MKMRPDVISQTMRSYLRNDQKKNVNAVPLNAIKLGLLLHDCCICRFSFYSMNYFIFAIVVIVTLCCQRYATKNPGDSGVMPDMRNVKCDV